MATRFAIHESVNKSDCELTDSGYFYKLIMKKGTFSKFYLVDGDGLTGQSNNPVVVPNSDAAFIGKNGSGVKRTVEIYGLSKGITLIGFYTAGSSTPVATMQVEVIDLSGKKPSFVAFDTGTVFALNAPDIAARFQYNFGPAKTKTVPGGPPEALFDSIPGTGIKHVVLCCHGQMTSTGVTVFIGGNLSRGNCNDVFAKLKSKCAGGIIWIGGCEVGADNDFCKAAVLASGCYLIAPVITLALTPIPANMIDFFGGSMPKFFNKTDGTPMKADDLMQKQKDLGFKIVPS